VRKSGRLDSGAKLVPKLAELGHTVKAETQSKSLSSCLDSFSWAGVLWFRSGLAVRRSRVRSPSAPPIKSISCRASTFSSDVDLVPSFVGGLDSFHRKATWNPVLPSSSVVMPTEASEYHPTRTKTVGCRKLTFSDNQRSIAGGKTSLNVSRHVVSPACISISV
jgi:hypothetical protein